MNSLRFASFVLCSCFSSLKLNDLIIHLCTYYKCYITSFFFYKGYITSFGCRYLRWSRKYFYADFVNSVVRINFFIKSDKWGFCLVNGLFSFSKISTKPSTFQLDKKVFQKQKSHLHQNISYANYTPSNPSSSVLLPAKKF